MASCRICNMIYAEHRGQCMFFWEKGSLCQRPVHNNISILPRLLHTLSCLFNCFCLFMAEKYDLCGPMHPQNLRCDICSPNFICHTTFVLPLAFLPLNLTKEHNAHYYKCYVL